MTAECLVHPALELSQDRARSFAIADVSGPRELLARAGDGLPVGAAWPEATAARLRRLGVAVAYGEPRAVGDVLQFCRRRGASSVEILRADPSLVTELQIGSWFDARWKERGARRLAFRLRRGSPSPELAFWDGVRKTATGLEWNRLTRSAYVVLVYHRLAGERKPGQERVDLDPGRFEAQLAFLRAFRFTPIGAGDLLAFHTDVDRALPPRSVVVTIDDALADVVEPLIRNVWARPQLFVPTAEVGGRAHWLDGEQVMTWSDVGRLEAAGVSVGSHAREHRHLTSLAEPQLEDDLRRSLADLRSRLERPLPLLAYPNGKFDERVRRAAARAGFEAAYSTEKGRNSAGTERFSLRRVSVHADDGRVAVLWKATTGASVPSFVWRWRRGVDRLRRLLAGIR
jgi:hypothetical protein